MNEVLEMMINAAKGITSKEFSDAQRSESIREAIIKLNGGSTKLSPKTFYRGSELFSLVEDFIPVAIDEGFRQDDAIFNLVEYKNIAEGDENVFYTEGNVSFVVADAAAGIKGVRRQRIDNSTSVTVTTSVKIIRIYEELTRFISGRIDFNRFVDAVAKAFTQKMLSDAYAAINAISAQTAGISEDLLVTGSYSEDTLFDLVQKVEAKTGMSATIYGSKAALKKVSTAVVSDIAKDDIYEMGYYGKFYGTPMVSLRQSYKPGTNEFNVSDDKLYIIAGQPHPIKVVNEGTGLMVDQDATVNADLTKEYVYAQTYGVGVIVSDQFGIYTIE